MGRLSYFFWGGTENPQHAGDQLDDSCGHDKPSMANEVVSKPEPRLKEMEDTGRIQVNYVVVSNIYFHPELWGR